MLSKLTIKYEQWRRESFTGRIVALFNPNQLSYSKALSWDVVKTSIRDKITEFQKVEYKTSEPTKLSVNLFFDTYEGDPNGNPLLRRLIRAMPDALAPPNAVSVIPYTDEVARLARFDRDLHRPPVCRLQWGDFVVFQGVLTDLSQEFSMFLANGAPVRANLRCGFMQYDPKEYGIRRGELHSADVAKKYTVRPGDTLSSIAADLLDDASQWRAIAQANQIDNPRRLTPGLVLIIPPLK
jgi:nucleoid-associated protein YgaU